MKADTLHALRTHALDGDEDALAILDDAMRDLGGLARRYLDGQHVAVWAELEALGAAVFAPEHHPQAWAIAWETMRRARRNLETLIARYADVGYALKNANPLGEPARAADLDAIEARAGGPIPLSMRAFWAVVGRVDLTQAPSQSRHGWLDDGVSDLEGLGDDDPLFVDPAEMVLAGLDALDRGAGHWAVARQGGRLYVEFAPDCFHKNNVSGGENYHLWIPDARADFRIIGDVCPLSECAEDGGQRFVSALRRTFEGGGFRGSVDFEAGDPDVSGWRAWKPLQVSLAGGLLPL